MSPNVATLILILHYDAIRFLVRLCTTRSPCHLGCLGRWFRVVLIQCLGVICSLPACFVQPFWFDRAVHAQWKIEFGSVPHIRQHILQEDVQELANYFQHRGPGKPFGMSERNQSKSDE